MSETTSAKDASAEPAHGDRNTVLVRIQAGKPDGLLMIGLPYA